MNNRSNNQLTAGHPMLDGVKFMLAGLVLCFFALPALAQTVLPSGLPLYFEANQNQTEFLSRGNGYQFLVSAGGAQITLGETADGRATAQMEFPGANARAHVRGDSELPGKINYLIGRDASQWLTGLPTFSKVQITDLYPGINLVFHGNQRQLEYDFTIAPGADPDRIRIHFRGAEKLSVTSRGGLIVKIGDDEIQQSPAEIYQTIAGERKTVSGSYKMVDARTVAFELGQYDHSLPLVIDPVLSYSVYFGGNVGNAAYGIALDTNSTAGAPNGFIYIAGQTFSTKFATSGAFQTNFAGGVYAGDAFVAKFSNPATNLIYLTYLGGSGDDAAYGVAVDTNGNVYLAGATESPNFPTNNAIPGHSQIGGYTGPTGIYFADAFVTEIAAGGSNLIYSTYLGGNSSDAAYAIALDSANNAYVTGFTYSTNFPVTTNALLTRLACSNNIYVNANAFVAEITNGGGALVYSTFLGGTNYDVGKGITIDSANDVYVAGYTASFNFPVWNVPTNLPNAIYLNGSTNENAYANPDGAYDAFVTKFPPLSGTITPAAQTNAFYSTLLGNTNSDEAYGIAADSSGCAYVTGWTTSTNFPEVFPNANGPPGLYSFLVTNGFPIVPITNVFLTKIAANGSAVDYSVVFGGNSEDIGYGVAVDAAGNAFVVGAETSTNFPTMNFNGPLNQTNSLENDAFVSVFNTNCSSMYYSVCIGGSENLNNGFGGSAGYGIAVDSADNAYITGQTSATNFPVANNAATNTVVFPLIGTNSINGSVLSGTNDAFVAEIALGPAPFGPQITNSTLTNLTVGVGITVNFSVSATGSPALTYQWLLNGSNLVDGGNILGSISNVLTITGVQTNDAGNYEILVSNDWGFASSNANLTVLQSPQIITPLTNQTVGIGATVSFALTATGTPTLQYYWQFNGTNLTNSSTVSGATTPTLTLDNVQTNRSGTYTVIVTNNYAPPATDSALLTVLSAPVMTLSLVSNNIADGLFFNIIGGSNDGRFHVFYTTNLLMPFTNPFGNPSFNSLGQFSGAAPGQTNPQEFFILTEP